EMVRRRFEMPPPMLDRLRATLHPAEQGEQMRQQAIQHAEDDARRLILSSNATPESRNRALEKLRKVKEEAQRAAMASRPLRLRIKELEASATDRRSRI